tara:strand:+ start:34 stop:555 length:522 start_codon:yes stop_codon:yes gene_type:complete
MSENQNGDHQFDDQSGKELNGLITDYLKEPEIIQEESTTMSSSIGDLAGALAKAQSEMTMVEGKGTNPFFNSKYATLASVLEVAMPALNKNEIALVQGVRWCTGTNGFYITSTLMHSSGQWIKSELRMPIAKKDAHGVGGAITYGRRYLLSAMTGIAQADDDGNSQVQQTSRR